MTGIVNERALAYLFISEQRRTRTLLRKLGKTILLLLALALTLSIFLALSKQLPVFYTVSTRSVTVVSGDTLWEIAGEHIGEYPGGIHSYLAELCRLNHIENGHLLTVGTELTVPIYRYRFG